MGPLAYKLNLPNTSRIHNVFHCSVLKAYEGPLPPSIDPLTPLLYENNSLVTPLAILGFKTNNVNGVLKRLSLVQWQGLSPDDTLWEDWITLQQTYDLEDKVISKGDGNVRYESPNFAANTTKDDVRPKRRTHKQKGYLILFIIKGLYESAYSRMKVG
ncbi:hypothetical protein V8G54_012041 [Vigna mungo]|uniref:Tf2-1-like SH3-like domain-containing protein n=1 Tax=Vigna mungo TaxID=3915 RepID=A0AAQ3NQC9_VIGMU